MNEETVKLALGYDLGSELHDAWRAPRKLEDGTYEPRMKKSKDEDWNLAHLTDDVDIANTDFKDLPSNWQAENLEAGKTAIDLVFDKVANGETPTEDEIEELSSSVHDAWIGRNSWVLEDPENIQGKPYQELPEEEKAKDRDHIIQAIRKVEDYRSGLIDIDELMEKYNIQNNKEKSL